MTKLVLGILIGVIVMAGSGLLLIQLDIVRIGGPGEQREYEAIAVLPLTGGGDDAITLGNAVCEELTTQLTQMGARVLPWVRTRGYGSTTRDISGIGAELGADAVVHGSLEIEGGRARAIVRLRDLSMEFPDLVVEVDAPVADPLITARFIAREIARGFLAPGDPGRPQTDAKELTVRGWKALQQVSEEGNREARNREARNLFYRALEVDPGYADAYVGLGTLYFRSSGNLQALAMYELALELDSHSVPARRGQVLIYWALGDFEKGLAVARSMPADMNRLNRLIIAGEAYMKCGLPRRAVAILEEARVLAPDDDGVLWNLAVAYNWSGRYREAVDSQLEYFRRFGEEGWLQIFTGEAYFGLGLPDSALFYYGKNVELAGQNPSLSHIASLEIHAWLGHEDLAREKRLEFVERVSKVLTTNPDYVWGRIMRAECYMKLGDIENFQAEKVALLPLVRERGTWSWFFAATLAQAGEVEEAMDLIRHGMSLGVVIYQGILRDDGKGQWFWAVESLTQHAGWSALRKEIRAKEEEMWEKYGIE